MEKSTWLAHRNNCLHPLFGCLCVVLISCPAAFAQRYDITYLEFPEEFSTVEIGDINNIGNVVGTGYYKHGVDAVPLHWRNSGELVRLPYLRPKAYATAFEGGSAWAWGMNDLGQIVGQSDAFMVGQKAVLWPGGHEIIDLLGRDSIAISINDSGVVVGTFSVGSLSDNAFRWERGN